MLLPRPIVAILATITALVSSAFGGMYTITLTGTFIDYSSLTAPFRFELTIDPSLNTSTAFLPATGDGDAFYGFSASSLLSTSLTFGEFTWTSKDIKPRTVAVGVKADFFLDTDLVSAAPSRIWLYASKDNDDIQLGGGWSSGGNRYFYDSVSLDAYDSDVFLHNDGPVTFTVSAIPEPSTVALAAGLTTFAVAYYVRRRRA